MILDVEGVESISSLKLNGSADDLVLGDEEIPKLGQVTMGVA